MVHDGDGYQGRLRSLGAYLDQARAFGVSLIESPSGFAVRYFRWLGPAGAGPEGETTRPEGCFEEFDGERLASLEEHLTKTRPPAEETGLKDSAGVSYQDFLRALGWELDDLEASNIVLDELEEAFYLTYISGVRKSPGAWDKRMASLGPGEKHAILRDARGRRKSISPL